MWPLFPGSIFPLNMNLPLFAFYSKFPMIVFTHFSTMRLQLEENEKIRKIQQQFKYINTSSCYVHVNISILKMNNILLLLMTLCCSWYILFLINLLPNL